MNPSVFAALATLLSGAAPVQHDGWSMMPPAGCDVRGEMVAANPLYDEQARRDLARDRQLLLKPGYYTMPRHVRFDLRACYPQADMSDASLRVLPVEDYTHIYDSGTALTRDTAAGGEFAALKTWLSGPPDAVANWPMIPFLDMSPQFTVARRALRFNGGRGIRVVTQFVPDVGFAQSGLVSYVFQGLSDDGRDFILLSVPLAIDGAASADAQQHLGFDLALLDTDLAARQRYEAAVQALVARHGTRPALAELDAIVESLRRDTRGGTPEQHQKTK